MTARAHSTQIPARALAAVRRVFTRLRDPELAQSLRDADTRLRAGETGSVDDLRRELRDAG